MRLLTFNHEIVRYEGVPVARFVENTGSTRDFQEELEALADVDIEDLHVEIEQLNNRVHELEEELDDTEKQRDKLRSTLGKICDVMANFIETTQDD